MRELHSEDMNETQVWLKSMPEGTMAVASSSFYRLLILPRQYINLIGLKEKLWYVVFVKLKENCFEEGKIQKTLSITVGFLTRKIYG